MSRDCSAIGKCTGPFNQQYSKVSNNANSMSLYIYIRIISNVVYCITRVQTVLILVAIPSEWVPEWVFKPIYIYVVLYKPTTGVDSKVPATRVKNSRKHWYTTVILHLL